MRTTIKTLAVLALGTLPVAVSAPVSLAADLGVTVKHHVHRHHLRVVADYDGTPVALRPRRDGTVDAVLARRASPSRYLNGEPIRAGARVVVE